MGLFSRKKPATSMGLAGHGMLLAPACPCRVALVEDLLVIGRGYQGPLLTEAVIKLGASPATEKPKQIADVGTPGGPMSHVFALGAGGPTIAFETIGAQLKDMFASVDVNLGPAEWSVLVQGFMFALPKDGFVLYSPDPKVDGDLPELHLAMKPDASITFKATALPPERIPISSPTGLIEPHVIEVDDVTIVRWKFTYVHEGVAWKQDRYGVVLGPGRTIVMTAQAPESMWPRMEDAALRVASSIQPLG